MHHLSLFSQYNPQTPVYSFLAILSWDNLLHFPSLSLPLSLSHPEECASFCYCIICFLLPYFSPYCVCVCVRACVCVFVCLYVYNCFYCASCYPLSLCVWLSLSLNLSLPLPPPLSRSLYLCSIVWL